MISLRLSSMKIKYWLIVLQKKHILLQTISTKLMLLLIGLKLRWTQFVFMFWVPPVNLQEIEFERNWEESDEKMAFRVGCCNFSTNCCQYSSKIHKTFQRGEFLLIFSPKSFPGATLPPPVPADQRSSWVRLWGGIGCWGRGWLVRFRTVGRTKKTKI